MKNFFSNYIFIILISILSASPGDASAVFLLISPGASSVATGEAQVAKADDAYATFFNPAGLAFQTGEEYAGMHVNWLPGLADDIYYEFIAYKKHIPWLGTVGGNITFLNLGEQAGMDEFQNSTGTFSSYMWAASFSYGSTINESSGWGTNFKLIHQKLADRVTAGESGKPYSTDFAFDLGYIKRFGAKPAKYKDVSVRLEVEDLFARLAKVYLNQKTLSEKLSSVQNFQNVNNLIIEQSEIEDQLNQLAKEFLKNTELNKFYNPREGIMAAIEDVGQLIDVLEKKEEKDVESIAYISDRILFSLLEVESLKDDYVSRIIAERVLVEKPGDPKLSLGFSISNIGPEVDFLDEQQADPMPTTMRMGLFSNVFSNETLKLNILFDANKMLVARYEQMDWNGNGVIESGKEQGFVDPWYEALYTSWLDDWYYGGDRNFSDASDLVDGQHIIGGYEFNQDLYNTGAYDLDNPILYTPTLEVNSDPDNSEIQLVNGTPISVPTYDPDEGDTFLDFNNESYGVYNSDGVKEKGTGDERSFSAELEDMVYSLGLELWYTDNFVFRAGYLHDQEGSLKHPTLGAGIKFGQYGFDLGYILGEKGEPRSNTLLFSINLEMSNGYDQVSDLGDEKVGLIRSE